VSAATAPLWRRGGTGAAKANPARPSRRPTPENRWEDIAQLAPQIAATMTAYLEQLAVSSRPATVDAASLALRQFAAHVTRIDPTCVSVAAIERRHVESYKIVLAARPGRGGNKTVSTETIRNNLGMVRTFFERVIDWDYPDAPRRVPVFAGDLPKANEPLPKFLDDPTAAKFMAALATDPDRRRRLMVELLARTGMRAGELAALQDDAMYRIGGTYWLRIPIGKLHNERTVPLHPMLVGLINDYRAWRGPSTTGLLVERNDHQPFDRRTIHRYVVAAGRRAGIDHVHPHALRHTLATQCINRGMSLEAIAALLGHRSPRMTLVYARIADTTVAEQYFNATRAVETENVTASSGGDTRRASDVHRRLLGNGHCTRPLELDCRFQTICEGCGFFQTGPEFVTILRRQRDDAATHADDTRTKLYDQLVRVIDDTATDEPPSRHRPRAVLR
jgi:integrase